MKWLVFLFIPVFSQGQLNKIGPFIPGKTTTSIVDSIAAANGVQIWETADNMEVINELHYDYTSKTKRIFYILNSCPHNDSLQYFSRSPIDERHSVCHIDYLTISDLLISDVWLSFWKDTLYAVEFDIADEAFEESLQIKYGEGVVAGKRQDSKMIICRNGLGITKSEEEFTITTDYKTNSANLVASATYAKFYNSKCEELRYNIFRLEKNTTKSIVDLAEKKIESAHVREIQKTQGANLKDL